MILAKNNVIVKIENSNPPTYAIMNPVSGSFDIMGDRENQLLRDLSAGKTVDSEFEEYLLERGYVYIDQNSQNAAIEEAYKEFSSEIGQSPVQLMLVPTYGCNLSCTYCYEHGIDDRPVLITREVVDAFFTYARDTFGNRSPKPFITLFGGEPLVNSPAQRSIIEYIIDKCAEEDYEIAAVTNGYDFVHFVDMLKKVTVKEIQFTLDGTKAVHDARRATTNKKGTFDQVVAGIAAAVDNGIPVNLRSVVDLENIQDLVNLAEYLDAKGWLDLPPQLFKTQLGRNYELFECYSKPQHLMTEVGLWGQFAALSKLYPILAKLHRPDFKGMRRIVDTGEMYMATYDTCPAAKTEWVFDLNGQIYGCTASCGREEYLLGTFWPEKKLNQEAIDTWQSRDVTHISKCTTCSYDAICGGGCGVVAANQNEGRVLSPDCRPIQELLDIGVNYYADELLAMVESDVESESEKPGEIPVESGCCG